MAYRAVRCRIPELCLQRGLEHQELAARAEINHTLLSDYIHLRKTPGIENAKAIAAVLRCTIDDLFEWEYYSKGSGIGKE